MGVAGLWQLLSPVGRRVDSADVGGQRLAVDASIWLTQFIRAMRDADGAMVRNAHLLGVLRRLTKLLALHARPVLVFDGGTPALKRKTLASRRASRARAAANLRRVAERLLLAQLKGRALNAAAAAAVVRRAKASGQGGGGKTPLALPAAAGGAATSAGAAVGDGEAEEEEEEGAEEGSGVGRNSSSTATPSGRPPDRGGVTANGDDPTRNDAAIAAALAASLDADGDDGGDGGGGGGGDRGVGGGGGGGGDGDGDKDIHAIDALADHLLPDRDEDIDAAALAALPPSLQIEAVQRLRQRRRAANREALVAAMTGGDSRDGDGGSRGGVGVGGGDGSGGGGGTAADGLVATPTAAVAPTAGGDRFGRGLRDPSAAVAVLPTSASGAAGERVDPAAFSRAQIAGYLSSVALNRRIAAARAVINDAAGVSRRIASDAGREFTLASTPAEDPHRFRVASGGGAGYPSGGFIADDDDDDDDEEPMEGVEAVATKGGGRGRGARSAGRLPAAPTPRRSSMAVDGGVGWASRALASRASASDPAAGAGRYGPRGPAINRGVLALSGGLRAAAAAAAAAEGGVVDVDALEAGSGWPKVEPKVEPKVGEGEAAAESQSDESDDDVEWEEVAATADPSSGPPAESASAGPPAVLGSAPAAVAVAANNDAGNGDGDSVKEDLWGDEVVCLSPPRAPPADVASGACGAGVLAAGDAPLLPGTDGAPPAEASEVAGGVLVATPPPPRTPPRVNVDDVQPVTRRPGSPPPADSCNMEKMQPVVRAPCAPPSADAMAEVDEEDEVQPITRAPPESPPTAATVAVGMFPPPSAVADPAPTAIPRRRRGAAADDEYAASLAAALAASAAETPSGVAPSPPFGAGAHMGGTAVDLDNTGEAAAAAADAPVTAAAALTSRSASAAVSFVPNGVTGRGDASPSRPVDPPADGDASLDADSSRDAAAVAEATVYSDSDDGNDAAVLLARADTLDAAATTVGGSSAAPPPPPDAAELARLGADAAAETAALSTRHATLAAATESVSAEMTREVQQLAALLGVPYITAPMEAEAQCAALCTAGAADAVVTEDADAFLFGAPVVYRRLFAGGAFAEAYRATDIVAELGCDRVKLVLLALLLGSDYTMGVHGVGIVNAMEILDAYPDEAALGDFAAWARTISLTDVSDEPPPPPPSETDGAPLSPGAAAEAKRAAFRYKHRHMKRNWSIPRAFPATPIIDAYLSPHVDASPPGTNGGLVWGEPDMEGLRSFCWDKFGWAPAAVDSAVAPVLAAVRARRAAGGGQTRLDQYFVPTRFAKIRSRRLATAVEGLAGADGAAAVVEDAAAVVPGAAAAPAASTVSGEEGTGGRTEGRKKKAADGPSPPKRPRLDSSAVGGTVADVRAALRARRLPTGGNKATLVARLEAALREEAEEEEDEAEKAEWEEGEGRNGPNIVSGTDSDGGDVDASGEDDAAVAVGGTPNAGAGGTPAGGTPARRGTTSHPAPRWPRRRRGGGVTAGVTPAGNGGDPGGTQPAATDSTATAAAVPAAAAAKRPRRARRA
ncbi:hypothetical protein MMPV_003422 [Pyropia vietnamensis]